MTKNFSCCVFLVFLISITFVSAEDFSSLIQTSHQQISSSWSNTLDFSRPLTGTFFTRSWEFGTGELSITNGHDRDAVAVLAYPSLVVHSAVYIRTGDSFTITGIQDGNYYLYFMLGSDWDGSIGKFTHDKSFFRFSRSLPFTTTWTDDGYQYTIYELTLHPVRGGNAVTNAVEEEDFPAIR